MRAKVLTVLTLVALGTTGAMAQTTGETPADPKLEQNAPSADPALPAGESKARMPMRRELPIVPDPNAASEGAGAGTSGSGAGAGTSGSAAPSAAEPGASGAAAPSATEPEQKEEKKY